MSKIQDFLNKFLCLKIFEKLQINMPRNNIRTLPWKLISTEAM